MLAGKLQIKRQRTFIDDSPDGARKNNSARRKTFSHFGGTFNPLKTKTASDEKQYVDLTKQCLEKHYDVWSLRPFGFKVSMEDLRKEVSAVEPRKTVGKDIFQGKKTITAKYEALISTAKLNPKRRKKNRRVLSENFIKSPLEDEHLSLIEDYIQDQKHDYETRKKTVDHINSRINKKFPDSVEPRQDSHTRSCALHQSYLKIVKFKRDSKVTQKISKQILQECEGTKKTSSYDLNKEDYGVYSRSCNKTFYFKSQASPSNAPTEQDKSRNHLISRNYYKGYLKSYGKRTKFLSSTAVGVDN